MNFGTIDKIDDFVLFDSSSFVLIQPIQINLSILQLS